MLLYNECIHLIFLTAKDRRNLQLSNTAQHAALIPAGKTNTGQKQFDFFVLMEGSLYIEEDWDHSYTYAFSLLPVQGWE